MELGNRFFARPDYRHDVRACLREYDTTGIEQKLLKLLREGKEPRAILLPGGGNDIAGEDFAVLLNHAASSLPTLNEDVIRGVIDVRIRAAYLGIIGGLTAIARAFLNRPLPIVTHGYGYAVPDGRGFLGGFGFLPGPWLEPGFRRKGHLDLEKNKHVIAELIDRFNVMLAAVSKDSRMCATSTSATFSLVARGTSAIGPTSCTRPSVVSNSSRIGLPSSSSRCEDPFCQSGNGPDS